MAENAFKADWPSFALGFNTGKSKGGSGGGVELNIAYGDAAPEDTTKLWVKCEKPSKVNLVTTMPTSINGIGNEYSASYYYNKLGYQPVAPACGVIGNRIYVLGGYTNIVYMDIETQAVTALSEKLPKTIHHMAYATVGHKIYMFGGRSNGSDIYNSIMVFDADEGKAYELENVVLPVAMRDMTAQAIGTKIYIFGGCETVATTGAKSNHILRFDTETNEFYGDVNETVLPVRITEMASAVVNNKIYLFGGFEHMTGAMDTIMEYDPENHTVRTLDTKLPRALFGSACSAYGGEVYLFGGGGVGSTYNTDIVRFNPSTEKAEKMSNTLTNAVVYGVAAEGDNRVYIFGGTRNTSNSHVLYFTKYGYELPTGTLMIQLYNGSGGLSFEAIKGMENTTINLRAYKAYIGDQNNESVRIPIATYSSNKWTEYMG